MFAMPYKLENDFFLGIFGERYQMELLSDQKSTLDSNPNSVYQPYQEETFIVRI